MPEGDVQKKKGPKNKAVSKYIKRKKKVQIEESTVKTIVGKYQQLNKLENVKTFREFPLSEKTLKGLDDCEYTEPTDIQRDSIPLCLLGNDVVAAAMTGSGKTLSMIIPILECLWRSHWSPEYGLGALVISPTRELALQTYTCLNNVGKFHNFSAALLIGGTDLDYERNRLSAINIIICTPGRLLQHLDENDSFNCDQLQILAIDEADRLLDMGFSQQVNAIMENLPRDRQTLLFSATQTKSVKDLCRVCMKDPVFVSAHERSTTATPAELKQFYMICEEHEKMNLLWSFIKHHKKKKMLVFVSSCKQARFITEAFCHLRPGLSVMGLWGSMNQTKRVDVFQKFEDTRFGVMIATDVAGRGLDFSDVDWVVQMDIAPNADDYIHRVGRTARMNKAGQAVMFVAPSQEEHAKQLLASRSIPIEKLDVNPSFLIDVTSGLRSVITQFPQLKDFAQASIIAYVRSVFLMRDKKMFDVQQIDVAALSQSYGLLNTPKIRFLRKHGINDKEIGHKAKEEEEESDSEEETEEDKEKPFTLPDVEDDQLFSVKKTNVFNVDTKKEDDNEELTKIPERAKKTSKKNVTQVALAKKILHKGVKVNSRIVFDEQGQAETKHAPSDAVSSGLNIEEAKDMLKQTSMEDRQRMKELKKRKKKPKKTAGNKDGDELDLGEGNESDVNNDVDLDWLPDPDRPKFKEGEEVDEEEEPPVKKSKKRSRKSVVDDEQQVLSMLNPFA